MDYGDFATETWDDSIQLWGIVEREECPVRADNPADGKIVATLCVFASENHYWWYKLFHWNPSHAPPDLSWQRRAAPNLTRPISASIPAFPPSTKALCGSP